jgi:hypothetical protein
LGSAGPGSASHLAADGAHLVQLVGELRVLLAVGGEQLVPGLPQLAATLSGHRREMLTNLVRHEEAFVLRPAVEPLRAANLLNTERLTVGGVVALLGRCAVGDDAVDDDDRRTLLLGLEGVQRCVDRVKIVRVVDVLHRPAVALEPGRDILGEAMLVSPSMVIRLLSYSQQRLDSFWWPPSEAASAAMPSIRQPSPQMA